MFCFVTKILFVVISRIFLFFFLIHTFFHIVLFTYDIEINKTKIPITFNVLVLVLAALMLTNKSCTHTLIINNYKTYSIIAIVPFATVLRDCVRDKNTQEDSIKREKQYNFRKNIGKIFFFLSDKNLFLSTWSFFSCDICIQWTKWSKMANYLRELTKCWKNKNYPNNRKMLNHFGWIIRCKNCVQHLNLILLLVYSTTVQQSFLNSH